MNITIESVTNGFVATECDVEPSDGYEQMREEIRVIRNLGMRDEDIRVFQNTHEDVRSVCLTPGELFAWLYKRLPETNAKNEKHDELKKFVDELVAQELNEAELDAPRS